MSRSTVTALDAEELPDWFGPLKTRDQHRRDALRETLANEYLSIDGAAWLIAGICPERSPGPGEQPGGWFLLPGIDYPEHELSSLLSFDDEITRRIAHVRGRLAHLVRGGMDAVLETRVVLALAIEHGLTPPWWDWASADPECVSLLPGRAEASQPASGKHRRASERQVEANRENAAAGWLANNRRQAILTIGGLEFDRLRGLDFPGCWAHGRKGKANATIIAARIEALIQEKLKSTPEAWPGYPAILRYARLRLKEADDAKSETDDAIA